MLATDRNTQALFMKLLMMGPPGSGKGTQARLLSAKYGMAMLSTGDLLRQKSQTDTPQGREIQQIMNDGGYISDETITALVRDWALLHPQGYLLDGFPRTVVQLENMIKLGIEFDYMVHLKVEEDVLIERLTGRLIHLPSGRIYHKTQSPPQVEGVDDVTGEELLERKDDSLQAVQKRQNIYRELTEPLIELIYRDQAIRGYKCIDIDGLNDPSAVFAQIEQRIGS